MVDLIKKIIANDKMRYLIAGGCTTFVNLILFFILRMFTDIGRNTCNAIAIAMAIAFAYFANKFFVFKSKKQGIWGTISEAIAFFGARMVSMAVEILGFAILCDSFRFNELVSKIMVQVVVLVLNYMFSKLFVFKKRRKNFAEHIADNYCYYLSFLIVSVLMLAIFIAQKIVPFGNNSITLVDSVHQYLPFYSEYRDKLINEGSLFYTWNIAMGSNFVSLSAYYLSSPFNYLFLLFGKENIALVSCVIILLKVSLSSVTMAYFISHKDNKKVKNLRVVAISVCYALSNYVIGYSWCSMWMDCIILLPLVILGFERLMKEKDPKLYTIALFLTLYCNYYIGFIICIFMVLWFFVYNHQGIKNFFTNGIRFAVYSLTSGGLTAFLLIPAYFGIMATAASTESFPKWKWYGNIFLMFKQQLFLTEPITNQTFDGGVNLYCGMLAVFALFLYIFSGRIKLSDKIRKILLLAILMVSFNSELLNYMWHGFHNQYGIPNRFSFLFIFVLLIVTYDVLREIKRMHVLYIISGALFTSSFILLCKLQTGNSIKNYSIITSLCMVVIYGIICSLHSIRKIKRKTFSIAISCVCIVEILINASCGFLENGHVSLDRYFTNSSDVTRAYLDVKESAKEDNIGFYRAELMESTVLDEASWHNMPSVGIFCSTVLGGVVDTMGDLGFYSAANEFLYRGSTPFTNSIFNVKYLLKRENDLNNFDFNYSKTISNVDIYQNPYPLSLGFCVNEKTKEWKRENENVFESQTKLANYMTGFESYFTYVDPAFVVSSDTCSTSIEENKITFTPYESGDASFLLSINIEEAGDYYVNCRGNNINKIHFYVNGADYAYDRYQAQIFHLGELKEGDYVAVEYCYKNLDTTTKTAHFDMRIHHDKIYNNHYDVLSENMLNVTAYDDGYIMGDVNMPEGKTLFTSIPYDEGWTVYVDGKKTEYYKICNAFIGVDMSPGEHKIEMVYVPKGLYIGIAISFISLVILLLGVMHNINNDTKKKLVINNNNEIDHEVNI